MFWDWVVSSPAAMHSLNATRAAIKDDVQLLNVPGAWLADLLYAQIKQMLPVPGGNQQVDPSYDTVSNQDWQKLYNILQPSRPAQATDYTEGLNAETNGNQMELLTILLFAEGKVTIIIRMLLEIHVPNGDWLSRVIGNRQISAQPTIQWPQTEDRINWDPWDQMNTPQSRDARHRLHTVAPEGFRPNQAWEPEGHWGHAPGAFEDTCGCCRTQAGI